jgi:hypothetical protein
MPAWYIPEHTKSLSRSASLPTFPIVTPFEEVETLTIFFRQRQNCRAEHIFKD